MAFTTYATAIAGTILTAAFWNTQVRDNGNVLKTSIANDGRISGDLKNFFESLDALTIASNTLTVDCASANVKTVTLSANITTTTLQNIPASGKFATLTFLVKANGSAFTWPWLTATVVWDGALLPVLITTTNHVMVFQVYTVDGGTTWRGSVVGANYAT